MHCPGVRFDPSGESCVLLPQILLLLAWRLLARAGHGHLVAGAYVDKALAAARGLGLPRLDHEAWLGDYELCPGPVHLLGLPPLLDLLEVPVGLLEGLGIADLVHVLCGLSVESVREERNGC